MIANDNQYFGIGFTATTTISSSASIQIQFPGTFSVSNLSATGSDVSQTDPVSGNNCYASNGIFGAGYNNTLSGLSVSASSGLETVTVTTSSALTATHQYCLFYTLASGVTNPSSAGTYNVNISTFNSGVLTDIQTIAIAVLGTGATCTFPTSQNCNAYTVSATITPTFTMSLGASSDSLGTLSSSTATESTGVTTTISTNARSGWFIWASDANGGLLSTTAGGGSCPGSAACIASVTGNTAYDFTTHTGANEYGLGVSADNTTPYQYSGGACTATHFCGSGLSKSVFYMVATSGSAANAVQFTSHEIADISPTSPPGADYGDTITLIGCGSF
jgi:hypothetical protein